MRLLFFDDVFGKAGRTAVEQLAPRLQREERIDRTAINVENIADGSGVAPNEC